MGQPSQLRTPQGVNACVIYELGLQDPECT